MLDPFWNQSYILNEFMEYNEGMSNMLGVSIYWTTGQWKISEIKRPVHVVICFQLSGKPQSLQ